MRNVEVMTYSWDKEGSKYNFKDFADEKKSVSKFAIEDKFKSGGGAGAKVSFYKGEVDIITFIKSTSSPYQSHVIAIYKDLTEAERLVVSKIRDVMIIKATVGSSYTFKYTSHHRPMGHYKISLNEYVLTDKYYDNQPKPKPNNGKKKIVKNKRKPSSSS